MGKNKDIICRMPPCPNWDIPSMQSWLEDMAQQGWLLKYPRHRQLTLEFHRTEPQPIRYRMEPTPKLQWSEDTYPEDEQMHLYAQLGWDFVCYYDGFFIYRCMDPAAPELNTDPSLEALMLKKWKKRKAWGFAWPAGTILLFAVLWKYGLLLSSIINRGGFLETMLVILGLYLFVVEIRTQRRLSQIIHALQDGKPIPEKNWRKSAKRHRIITIAMVCVSTLAYIYSLFFNFTTLADLKDPRSISLEEWSEPVPFVTLQELDPIIATDHFDRISNPEGKKWFSILSPVNYEWIDGGEVRLEEGIKRFSSLLQVNYHETVSPIIARQLARDYQGRHRIVLEMKDENWHQLDLGIDHAMGYYIREDAMTTVVLCHKNVVVWCKCGSSDPEGILTTENWAKLMAKRLLENE